MKVIMTDKPGISTTLVGEQVLQGLKDLGVDAEPLFVDARSTPDLSTVHKEDVVSLVEGHVPLLFSNPRFMRPKTVTSVWVANWEGFPLTFQMSYASIFLNEKFGGIPVLNVPHSLHTMSVMSKFVRNYLKPSYARSFEQTSKTIPYGVAKDVDFVKGDPNSWIVPMNRVNQSQKCVQENAECSRQFSNWAGVQGDEVKFTMFHAEGFGPGNKKTSFDRDIFNFETQPEDRAGYMDNAQDAGAFLCTSNFESFGIYYLELIMSGCVGVFQDRPWVRALLPEYKFIVPKSELVAAMTHVHQNYDEAFDYVRDYTDSVIRKAYSLDRFCSTLYEEVQKLQGESE